MYSQTQTQTIQEPHSVYHKNVVVYSFQSFLLFHSATDSDYIRNFAHVCLCMNVFVLKYLREPMAITFKENLCPGLHFLPHLFLLVV